MQAIAFQFKERDCSYKDMICSILLNRLIITNVNYSNGKMFSLPYALSVMISSNDTFVLGMSSSNENNEGSASMV